MKGINDMIFPLPYRKKLISWKFKGFRFLKVINPLEHNYVLWYLLVIAQMHVHLHIMQL